MPYTPRTSGGGSSSPQLPAWTYTADSIGDGLFTTNNSDIGNTSQLIFSGSVLGTGSYVNWSTLPIGSIIIFTDSAGVSRAFQTTSAPSNDANPFVNVNPAGNAEVTPWSGKYMVSFSPGNQTAAGIGLGNVDNTSDASKPVSTAQAAAIAAVTAGGFSGSGIYTSFTFVNGICTAAS